MIFTNVGFLVFLALTAFAYYILPKNLQNLVLVLSSAIFYFFNMPSAKNAGLFMAILPPLSLYASIVFTFFLAKQIEKANGKKRTLLTALTIIVLVLVLCVFKYSNAFAPVLLALSGGALSRLALPLGISFYTFTSLGYIFDVKNGDIKAETNFIRYCAFVSFFGTIISGPICRAPKMLPQLSKQRVFNAGQICDALRLLLFGYFKWIAIANVLGLFVNEIFANSQTMLNYGGFALFVGAIAWAFQLYFEFSGYSDIARGAALIFGLDIPVNFKTPYFSMNFSALWSAWHISLSSWLQDYIFTPLVWSRWPSKIPLIGAKYFEKPPVISSVAIVFIISGIWHGNTMPFFVWGILQATFRVCEELLHRFYKKPQKKPKLSLRIFKTTGVFTLWCTSLIFFRIGLMPGGTVGDALNYIAQIFTNFSATNSAQQINGAIQSGFYTRDIMMYFYLSYLAFVLMLAFYFDWKSCFKLKGAHIQSEIAKQKPLLKWAIYYLLIVLILVGFIMQSGGFGTVSFAYAQF